MKLERTKSIGIRAALLAATALALEATLGRKTWRRSGSRQ